MGDMTIKYTLQRSRRKTVQISIKPDCSIVVKAPYRVPLAEIEKFIFEKQGWIEKNITRMQQRNSMVAESTPITTEEINALADSALKYFPPLVKTWAEKIGVKYGRITIRNQRSRWGSCSQAGNLNFNCLLMELPEEIREYVVIHELCHRLEMNHSAFFWAEVEKHCPDYKILRKRLKEEGSALMIRRFGT
ncbi:MAG: M48 family metallopeptidase [Lachnospiraceae bacterium]|nr:M48 family metallopeptidase [Lachnospiraceae bacterium]